MKAGGGRPSSGAEEESHSVSEQRQKRNKACISVFGGERRAAWGVAREEGIAADLATVLLQYMPIYSTTTGKITRKYIIFASIPWRRGGISPRGLQQQAGASAGRTLGGGRRAWAPFARLCALPLAVATRAANNDNAVLYLPAVRHYGT